PFFFIIVFNLLYFRNAAAKPFLLYLEVIFSPTLSPCFKLGGFIFTKAFISPGSTGGFVFAEETIKQSADVC
ncbi:MAG: hypothetical protein K2F67_07795, partial [Eubacterium sp.]|nr:hypothetical protein [Eubacterium sp.]